jgi:DNA-binding CsgD family transcriptional regulator
MGNNHNSYNLYFKFIEAYRNGDFKEIDRNDPLIKELELMTEINNQFFFAADLISMKILFCSNRSLQMIGVDPEILSPYQMNQVTHHDDLNRRGLAVANRMKLANIFMEFEKGYSLLSSNFRIKNPAGSYSNVLFQCYTFFSPAPKNTVYHFQVHTNIDWYDKLKGNYHYYCGEDISKFRYPDEELLSIVNPYSDREFEILSLLALGYSTEQIARKLFLSPHTVNTHRRNILLKTGHNRIQELIADLKVLGLL